jgi:hypothetical protein
MQEENKKRLELLKQARQELSNRYIKDRADAYTQWVIDSDQAWKESGIKLPLAPPPPIPTETDIVAYALALYNAQNPAPSEPPASEPVPPVHTVVEPNLVAVPLPVAVETPVIASPPEVPVPDSTTATSTTIPDPLLSTPIIPQSVIMTGPADFAASEAAIKEIFNKPSSEPAIVPTEQPAPSVVPLIKTMRNKGLLPNWIKSSTNLGAKE